MRRTYADKRKAVMTLLDDFEWRDMSNTEIAKHCHVSPSFVSDLRKGAGKDTGDTVKYKTSTGKVMEKKKAPGRAPKEPELKGPEITPPAQDDQNQEAIDMLLAENEELKARVAVVAMEGTPEEKQAAGDLINELREELRDAPRHSTHVHYTRNAAAPQRLGEGVSAVRRVTHGPRTAAAQRRQPRPPSPARRVRHRGEGASVYE
jgi:hypothetical protein